MIEEKKFTRKKLDLARAVAEKRFGGRENVTGIDVGYQWQGEKPTKTLCVRVHVKEKIPASFLESAELFPKEIDGVPLDVIQGNYQIREASKPSDHVKRFPVLLGGISVGHKDVTAGTLGALVIDQSSGKPAILSNWHVLAGPTGRPGDNVLQPGPADGGRDPLDSVATLERSILDADGDAAIAHLNLSRPWVPYIFGVFAQPTQVRDSVLGEKLTKSGRTTAQTSAKVDGEGVYYLDYSIRPGVMKRVGIQGFKLVSITQGNPENEELSSGGDSGSLWTDTKGEAAVGLHFAGEIDPNPLEEHAIACNMKSVVHRLNIRLAAPEDISTFINELSSTPNDAFNHQGLSQAREQAGAELSVSPDGPPGSWPGVPSGTWPRFPGGPFPSFPPLPKPCPQPDPWCPQCGFGFGGGIAKPFRGGGSSMLPQGLSQTDAAPQIAVDAYSIVFYALKRNHNIQPEDVQPFFSLSDYYGLNGLARRNLAVPINQRLQPLGAWVSRDETQKCVDVADLARLIHSKL